MRRFLTLALAVTAFAAVVGTATAFHPWGNYHWARTANQNPFTLNVIDSMTTGTGWDGRLNEAILDWDESLVMDVKREAGDSSARARKRCAAVKGKVRACNAAYGFNGWLGLATISLNGSHITQATAKMNDSYFASTSYSEANRQHVICQEIGHAWGLGHQSESAAVDLRTCMDYSSALSNRSPNTHDYEELQTIYGGHSDSTTTIAAGLAGSPSAKPVRVERTDRFADSTITEHFRDGTRRITHVFWALEVRGRAAEHAFGNDG